jgi:hypothetical protein
MLMHHLVGSKHQLQKGHACHDRSASWVLRQFDAWEATALEAPHCPEVARLAGPYGQSRASQEALRHRMAPSCCHPGCRSNVHPAWQSPYPQLALALAQAQQESGAARAVPQCVAAPSAALAHTVAAGAEAPGVAVPVPFWRWSP